MIVFNVFSNYQSSIISCLWGFELTFSVDFVSIKIGWRHFFALFRPFDCPELNQSNDSGKG